MERSDKLRQGAVVVGTVATIAINALAVLLPLNGQETGAISDRLPTTVTPAGLTFSVWSVIYVGVIAYTIWQLLPRNRTDRAARATGWPFVVTCVANSAWIFLWHYNVFLLTVPVMLVLLGGLLTIYLTLSRLGSRLTRPQWWFAALPFSLYLGWITVATIINIAAVMVNYGWNGFGISAAVWGMLLLVVATLIGAFIGLRQGDLGYTGVLAWAFFGIIIARPSLTLVAATAGIGAVVVLAAAVAGLVRQSRRGTGIGERLVAHS